MTHQLDLQIPWSALQHVHRQLDARHFPPHCHGRLPLSFTGPFSLVPQSHHYGSPRGKARRCASRLSRTAHLRAICTDVCISCNTRQQDVYTYLFSMYCSDASRCWALCSSPPHFDVKRSKLMFVLVGFEVDFDAESSSLVFSKDPQGARNAFKPWAFHEAPLPAIGEANFMKRPLQH